ncbi:hypothetical protein WOLCODRAFT_159689 [Wolfiporia cocos MD-104 SS10]|uniref:Uncharacterized protein n=1 Tax=Wolfiporia cocos (strain MD-104) TaxID=742152 RepID=A0A2H3JEH5_WOLCO|nr:hypothetical protein WOLCODRAFT_159689 [Wolfiporia cocos MD-104 SS10]
MHNWLCIRQWCFSRAFDPPAHSKVQMTAAQWRLALEGRYYRFPYDHAAPQSSIDEIARLPPLPNHEKEPGAQPEAMRGHKAKLLKQRSRMRTTDRIDVAVVLNVHGGFVPYDARAVCPSWGTRHVTREVVEGAQDLWAEVVWELSVVSFRLEFLHADRALAPTHYTVEDDILLREQLVTDIWLNNEEDAMLLRPNWEEQTPCDGLVHRDWQRRRHSVTGMVRVLASWPDSGHLYVPQENCTQSDFEHAEEIAIRFYATAYRRKFGRLPTFPLQCPASLYATKI